jgi:hypothetical protein
MSDQETVLCAEGILMFIEENPHLESNPVQIRDGLQMSKANFDHAIKWMQQNCIYSFNFQPTND